MKHSSFKVAGTIFGIGASLKILAVATAIGMLALTTPVHAKSLGYPCTSAPQNQWLPVQELQAKVEALGYMVQKNKLAKGCAEFYVLDKNGGKTELFVDPTNGQIVSQLQGGKR
ncbi:MAG: PepSY domain-containing protein [Burkholderiales bacterium]|nr:PepSY domain-containing protein [Burkholderiales bacterium]